MNLEPNLVTLPQVCEFVFELQGLIVLACTFKWTCCICGTWCWFHISWGAELPSFSLFFWRADPWQRQSWGWCVWEGAVISVQDLLHEEPPSAETGFISPHTGRRDCGPGWSHRTTRQAKASIHLNVCLHQITVTSWQTHEGFSLYASYWNLFLSVLASSGSLFWFSLTAHVIPWLFSASKGRPTSLKRHIRPRKWSKTDLKFE